MFCSSRVLLPEKRSYPGAPGGVERTRSNSNSSPPEPQSTLAAIPVTVAPPQTTITIWSVSSHHGPHTPAARSQHSDPGEHVTNGRREPLAAPCRRDTPVIACDGPQ